MAGWTNKGKYRALGFTFRAQTRPSVYYIALVTDAVAPAADTNTLSELTQTTGGTGYTTNGMSLTPGATDFDVWTEDDASDIAYVQLKDIVWTASSGDLGPARYAVLTDDNATPGSREVYIYWSLGSNRTVSDTQTLTLQNCEMRLTE